MRQKFRDCAHHSIKLASQVSRGKKENHLPCGNQCEKLFDEIR